MEHRDRRPTVELFRTTEESARLRVLDLAGDVRMTASWRGVTPNQTCQIEMDSAGGRIAPQEVGLRGDIFPSTPGPFVHARGVGWGRGRRDVVRAADDAIRAAGKKKILTRY